MCLWRNHATTLDRDVSGLSTRAKMQVQGEGMSQVEGECHAAGRAWVNHGGIENMETWEINH